jgi:hypothetical protein
MYQTMNIESPLNVQSKSDKSEAVAWDPYVYTNKVNVLYFVSFGLFVLMLVLAGMSAISLQRLSTLQSLADGGKSATSSGPVTPSHTKIRSYLFDTGCWAPPEVYGGACFSDTGLFASDLRTYVCYTAEPEGDTTLYCQGLGYGSTASQCEWGYHDLYADNCVLWGNSAGTPAVKCYGSPLGSAFKWSYTYGIGTKQCVDVQHNSNNVRQAVTTVNDQFIATASGAPPPSPHYYSNYTSLMIAANGESCCTSNWNGGTCQICCKLGSAASCWRQGDLSTGGCSCK